MIPGHGSVVLQKVSCRIENCNIIYSSIGNAGGLQIALAPLGNPAWIAIIRFLGPGFGNRAGNAERRHGAEWIDECGGRIGHREHVGCFDRFPATDGGAIETKAISEDFFSQFTDGTGEMLPGAEGIDEFDVDHFGALLARHIDHTFGSYLSASAIRLLFGCFAHFDKKPQQETPLGKLGFILYCRFAGFLCPNPNCVFD